MAKRGRKPISRDLSTALRILITIDKDSISKAQKLGKGNVSAGIREALRRARNRSGRWIWPTTEKHPTPLE